MTMFDEICLTNGMEKFYRKMIEENGLYLIELDSTFNINYMSAEINNFLNKKEKETEKFYLFNFLNENFSSLPIQIDTLCRLEEGQIYKATTKEFINMQNVQLDWTFINASVKFEKLVLIIIKKETKIINDFWHSTFTSFIDQFECYVFLKDINSRYISANKNFLNLYHFKNRQEIISKTDYDLCWTREESDLYIQDDKKVMEQKKSLTLIHETQTHQQTGIKKTLVTSKYPLYADPANIIGLIGFYVFLEKNVDLAILRFIDSKWKDYNQQQKYKYHEYTYEDTKVMLTNREAQCAALLLKGLSIKSIALELELSHRTIEKYVEALKSKFNSYSKEGLLRKIIKSNIIDSL